MQDQDKRESGEVRQIAQLLEQVGTRRLNRRDILRRGVALGLTVPAIGWLLSACGGDDDDDDDDGGASTAATATTATGGDTTASPTAADSGDTGGNGQDGGTLTLIISGNVPDLDPQSAYDSTASG